MIALFAGCTLGGFWGLPEASLERMVVQPRVDAFEDPRLPPEGMVVWDPQPLDPTIATGLRGGLPVDRIPLDVDRTLMIRGRDRYEVFCAPCHALDGTARTPVADAMPLRPRDLHTPGLDPYRVFTAAREGYGLMPSYGDRLGPIDAWAVAAYVQALRGRVVHLDELPPELRADALREAR